MYADKERQREANREANRRYRERKGITKVSRGGVTEGVTVVGVSRDPVIPEMPDTWGGPEVYEEWAPVPKAFAVDDKADSVNRPLPKVKSDWMVAKERQMAEFLKRYGK